MIAFDPFTATLAEAFAQPNPHDAVPLHGEAQAIIEDRPYLEKNPLEGVARCVRYGLVAPAWLAAAFLRQYDEVLWCRLSTWDEAFGPAHPPGKHLSTLLLRRELEGRLQNLFTGINRLPRTLAGRQEAARIFGITEKQVRTLLGKTRTNVKGHKPYTRSSSTAARANDPFSITSRKVPKK
ncbi:hypothetical protein [Polaromonas sp. JS666]|uniref:hypothetical protein n=1 Tax=Polaromonas sp. (strain JS666 / ATCC BAA-500) TaxID=296591 RepID=UPI0000534A15|nr:hypothetical protein [Polaromonas sp. JS666]ABE44879.1 hypothetical protein Bpro_2965 [Polaromonas sp. JS666]